MSIESLYQQYLGRGVDPSGAATYAGWSDQDIQNAITSSPEYAQRQQQQQQPQQQQQQQPQQQQGDGADINSIYQQYLGRGVDPSGAATYAGWNPQDIVNAIKGSPEYAQLQGSGSNQSNTASNSNLQPASEAPNWLRPEDYVANGYAAPYSQQQITSAVDPSTIRQGANGVSYAGLTGASNYFDPTSAGEYVVDPKTNKFVLDGNGNPIAVPRPNDPNSFNSSIADTWIPLGIAAMAAGTGLGAAGLIGESAAAGAAMGPTYAELGYIPAAEAAGATGAVTQALPYTSSFDAANLYANGITSSTQLGDILASTGIDPFLAADMGNLASQGLSADAISQILGYSYTPAELAGTGIDALGTAAGANTLANLLKNAKSLIGTGAPLMKALGSIGGAKGLSGALKNPTGTTGTGSTGSTGMGATFAQAKGNQNPFYFGTQTPVASATQSKADPFAALNVQQMTPQQQYNPLAALLKEGIYRG